MSEVKSIGSAEFHSQVLESDLPVVVDFYATWCPPCRALAPILQRLAVEFDGRVRFVKVDSDEEPELAGKYGVTALPTLVFIRGGNVDGAAPGLPEESALRREIERWATSSGAQQP